MTQILLLLNSQILESLGSEPRQVVALSNVGRIVAIAYVRRRVLAASVGRGDALLRLHHGILEAVSGCQQVCADVGLGADVHV